MQYIAQTKQLDESFTFTLVTVSDRENWTEGGTFASRYVWQERPILRDEFEPALTQPLVLDGSDQMLNLTYQILP
jgi:hypothetical protein